MRRSWIADKGLTAFSLWSPDHPATEIDIFISDAPLDRRISLTSAPSRRSSRRPAMANDSDGWTAHERAQRLAWRALTPAQRLAWLWQAKLFARRALGRARIPRKPVQPK